MNMMSWNLYYLGGGECILPKENNLIQIIYQKPIILPGIVNRCSGKRKGISGGFSRIINGSGVTDLSVSWLKIN